MRKRAKKNTEDVKLIERLDKIIDSVCELAEKGDFYIEAYSNLIGALASLVEARAQLNKN